MSDPPAAPSFVIRGAVAAAVQPATLQPRWDRINSAVAIAAARRIYFLFLERAAGGSEPLGIVLAGLERSDGTPDGRVVFEPPVLLPREQFIPLELVRGRLSRSRPGRSPFRS